LPRSRRRRNTGKVGAVRALIEGEGYIPQERIAEILGIRHETVKRILRDDLNMPKANSGWMLYAPTSSEKAVRVQVSRELLDFLESCTD
jgi:hypothetical protein